MDGLITFVAPFFFGALIMAVVFFLIDQFSDPFSNSEILPNGKLIPHGKLIFTQINEDEAKVEVEIDKGSWLDVMYSDKVVLKVVRNK